MRSAGLRLTAPALGLLRSSSSVSYSIKLGRFPFFDRLPFVVVIAVSAFAPLLLAPTAPPPARPKFDVSFIYAGFGLYTALIATLSASSTVGDDKVSDGF